MVVCCVQVLVGVVVLCCLEFGSSIDQSDMACIDSDDDSQWHSYIIHKPNITIRSSLSVTLSLACSLLGLSRRRLESVLTCRHITASHSRRKSVFVKPCTVAEASARRDCLAKLLYEK